MFGFYTEVLGWYPAMLPITIHEYNFASGMTCTDVFGASWEMFKIELLSTGD